MEQWTTQVSDLDMLMMFIGYIVSGLVGVTLLGYFLKQFTAEWSAIAKRWAERRRKAHDKVT